jgi:hypothetical protein
MHCIPGRGRKKNWQQLQFKAVATHRYELEIQGSLHIESKMCDLMRLLPNGNTHLTSVFDHSNAITVEDANHQQNSSSELPDH